jgi:mono/diheme cytochrome c family protein
MRRRIIPLTLGALLLASCGQDDWTPDDLLTGQVRTPQEEQLARGRVSYNTYCVGCHGEQGDGEGPAAKFLSPKPRDLRKGKLKFAGVAANEVPRDEDYVRVITRGLHGTSMPTWNLIPEQEVRDLVAFVRTFAPDHKAPGAEVPIPADPWTKKPEKGIEEGEKLYHGLASCMNCHPAYATYAGIAEHMKAFDIPLSGFRTNLYESETKESDWGAPIRPPDFWRDPMKAGATKEDLARVIATGIGGTAMPSWGATLTPKQLWGLAYYVESLTKQRGRAEADRQALLAQPAFVPPPPPPPPAPPPEAEGADAGAPDAATDADSGAKAKDGKKDK